MSELIKCYKCGHEFKQNELTLAKPYLQEEEEYFCKSCLIKENLFRLRSEINRYILVENSMFDFNLDKANAIVIKYREDKNHYEAYINYDTEYFVVVFDDNLMPTGVFHFYRT
jgi:DNA-directed RNA polymerase subunit RPC12/RpoP